MKRMLKSTLLMAMLSALAWPACAIGQTGPDDQTGQAAGQAGPPLPPTLDRDRDGLISAQEHAAGAEAMFQRMDADRDGSLAASELERGRGMTAGVGTHSAMGPGMMGQGMGPTMMDLDGDGAISAEEHAAMAQAMFQRMDSDRDGRISAAEMGQRRGMMMGGGMPGMGQGMGRGMGSGAGMGLSPADRLKLMDRDGDGRISAVEHAAGTQALFNEADTDNDGNLSMAERAAHHAEMMRRVMDAGEASDEGG